MLHWVKDSADWLAAVGAGAVVLAVAGRWLLKRGRKFAAKWDNAREVLVGREEIRHPDTGKVLAPATPGLGRRIATMEEALIAIGNTRQEMQDLTRKVGDLSDQFGTHLQETNELEMERTKEREQMWQAIRAVATPTPWDGVDRRQAERTEG